MNKPTQLTKQTMAEALIELMGDDRALSTLMGYDTVKLTEEYEAGLRAVAEEEGIPMSEVLDFLEKRAKANKNRVENEDDLKEDEEIVEDEVEDSDEDDGAGVEEDTDKWNEGFLRKLDIHEPTVFTFRRNESVLLTNQGAGSVSVKIDGGKVVSLHPGEDLKTTPRSLVITSAARPIIKVQTNV